MSQPFCFTRRLVNKIAFTLKYYKTVNNFNHNKLKCISRRQLFINLEACYEVTKNCFVAHFVSKSCKVCEISIPSE